MCMPEEGGCVTMQLTDHFGSTVYWRGCNIMGLQEIEDGCSCDESGTGFYCKKTCQGDKCNNQEHMWSVDKVKVILVLKEVHCLTSGMPIGKHNQPLPYYFNDNHRWIDDSNWFNNRIQFNRTRLFGRYRDFYAFLIVFLRR